MQQMHKEDPIPPITLRKAFGHFKTITHHRHLVRRGCFAVGLYRQGLTHDLSKYAPTEFLVGARYYQGDRSPNNAEREQLGYSTSWIHHKGRNRHHYEYWYDYPVNPQDTDVRSNPSCTVPVKMPGRYVIEMLMDRIAACKTYMGDRSPLAYFRRGEDDRQKLMMHRETAELLEKLLVMLAESGEKETFSYIRAHRSELLNY